MFPKKLLQCVVAVMVALPLYGFADSFNVKPGAWEMTTTTTSTGSVMPAEALAKMSPEQRAKVEQAIQASSGKPTTRVDKHCVTQNDLDEDRLFKSTHENQCTRKIVAKSATRIVLEQTCAAPSASTATITIETQSPDSLTTTVDFVRGGGDWKMHLESHGRWLGDSCAGIENHS